MQIFNYTFTNFYNHIVASSKNNVNNLRLNTLSEDKFERSNPLSFYAKRTIAVKAIENNFKNIEGLHDPYSDVVLLTPNRKSKIAYKLNEKNDTAYVLGLMAKYTCHMFEPEREIYNKLVENYNSLLKNNPKKANNITLSEMLTDILPEAKINLVNQQFDTLYAMRTLASKQMSKDSQKVVTPVFDNIEQQIYTDEFRTINAIAQLYTLKGSVPENDVLSEIFTIADSFPRSAISSDVFVLKNRAKSNVNIAMALISPAEASIEHIKPQSDNGASSFNNYIVASTRMNNLRKSTSLDEFIRKYPNIPKCTQRYMNDLIAKVNTKDFKDIGVSIPYVKDQLYSVSNGLIDLDISLLDEKYIQEADNMQSAIAGFNALYH